MTAPAPTPASVSDDRPLGDQPLPPVAGARPRAAHKGQQTKAAIIDTALPMHEDIVPLGCEAPEVAGRRYRIAPRSIIVLRALLPHKP